VLPVEAAIEDMDILQPPDIFADNRQGTLERAQWGHTCLFAFPEKQREQLLQPVATM